MRVTEVPPAICVQNLSKRYQLRHDSGVRYRTLRDELAHAAGAPLRWLSGRRNSSSEEFWALKDVTFEVQPGEVVGVIGRNGAGKSTLLKILSRITRPTTGRVELRGRVGSLLEVGTGFHPEMTGRENIFLSGAVLGMKRSEIVRKFDEIVAFAEVEKFLDTPVKRYSSGMYVRLAFSVAAHLEPDILIIDEVLAVGDAAFQRKCLGRVEDLASHGRTVLFVSHNLTAVRQLCSAIIHLEAGKIADHGDPMRVIESHLQRELSSLNEVRWSPTAGPGNERARMTAVRVIRADGTPVSSVSIAEQFFVEIDYVVLHPGAKLNVSLSIFSADGVYVLASPSQSDAKWHGQPHPGGTYRSRCQIPPLLNQGIFLISAVLVENASAIGTADRVVSLHVFDEGGSNGSYFGYWGGVIRPQLQWSTDCLRRHETQAAS